MENEIYVHVGICHDIWVNWVEGNRRLHEVPSFFEWKKTDEVKLLDTVPIVKVVSETFYLIANNEIEVPKDLLKKVYKRGRAENPGTGRKKQTEALFIITDGNDVLAIDTTGGNMPVVKSRLNTRQDIMVIEIMQSTPPVEFETGELLVNKKSIWNTTASNYRGLTAVEREMKDIILDCLFEIDSSKDFNRIFYWYKELFPTRYSRKDADVAVESVLIEEMVDFIKEGWSEHHIEFGTQVTKYSSLYKKEWKSLVKSLMSKDVLLGTKKVTK